MLALTISVAVLSGSSSNVVPSQGPQVIGFFAYYLPLRRRPGTGDIVMPPVRLSVRPSHLVFAL